MNIKSQKNLVIHACWRIRAKKKGRVADYADKVEEKENNP